MNFKFFYKLIICGLFFTLSACSNSEDEAQLVDLFTVASFDIVSISFPVGSTEDTISINSYFDYKIQGLKSNAVDTVAINDHIAWSLSDGANSSINQNGRFTSSGVVEVVTITAQVGHLTASQQVTVSNAKFDQVVALNSTVVEVNMCQAQKIIPIGKYINDDTSVEIRNVDNADIGSIEWIIRNQEDNSPSQRALIQTANDITLLQGLEAGDIFIQAKATSVSSGIIITSGDFTQTIDNNLNTLKLCSSGDSNLSTCSLINNEVVKDNVTSLIAVGNYLASDGSNFNQNISEYSKWGIDNNANASIKLSTDRQQLDITGILEDTTATISVACGEIEQTVTDAELENGVVLAVPVTCDIANLGCLSSTAAMDVVVENVKSLSVTANGSSVTNDIALILGSKPFTVTLSVKANYPTSTSVNVTDDINVTYVNNSTDVISEVIGTPGKYTVKTSGNAEVQITYQGQIFTVKITIP